jgi:hypothetical protein
VYDNSHVFQRVSLNPLSALASLPALPFRQAGPGS